MVLERKLEHETATRIKSLLLRWKIFKRASCDTRYNSRYSQNASLMLDVLLSATAKHYWRELARTNCKENGVSPRFANNPLIRFALRVSDVNASPHWDSLATQRISRFFERFLRKGVLVTWPLSKAGVSRYSMLLVLSIPLRSSLSLSFSLSLSLHNISVIVT